MYIKLEKFVFIRLLFKKKQFLDLKDLLYLKVDISINWKKKFMSAQ